MGERLEELVTAWRSGKAGVEAVLDREVYAMLRRMAGARLAHNAPMTLNATALVHEAVARLLDSTCDWTTRAHFFALVAMQMRSVLVDSARRRRTTKHGGGAMHVSLGGVEHAAPTSDERLLELEDALVALASRDARAARAVELSYFGGMSAREIAPVLGISEPTVERDLAYGRSWLRRALTG